MGTELLGENNQSHARDRVISVNRSKGPDFFFSTYPMLIGTAVWVNADCTVWSRYFTARGRTFFIELARRVGNA